MTRPGGNFTQPDHDYSTGLVAYRVYVAWQRLPEKYETEVEARTALHAAVNPLPVPLRRKETG